MEMYLLPRIVSKEKNIILPVDKYKLPAWSKRVFQLSLNSEHLCQLLPQLMIAAEPGYVKWAPNWTGFVNLWNDNIKLLDLIKEGLKNLQNT